MQDREIKKTGSRAAAMNLAFYGMGGVDGGVHDNFTSLGSLPHLLVLFSMGLVGQKVNNHMLLKCFMQKYPEIVYTETP